MLKANPQDHRQRLQAKQASLFIKKARAVTLKNGID
jgi:hypothetical protein